MSHFTLVVPESLARPPRGLEFASRAVEGLRVGDVLDLEAEKERSAEVLERWVCATLTASLVLQIRHKWRLAIIPPPLVPPGRLHASLNPATRQRHTPGSGAVGIALEASPFCHHLERDGVSVVFAGEVIAQTCSLRQALRSGTTERPPACSWPGRPLPSLTALCHTACRCVAACVVQPCR